MTNDSTPNVRLHIDGIVLHGFERVDRTRVRAALEGELSRLFSDEGGSAGLGRLRSTPRLDTAPLRAAPDATPETLGLQLAQTIYGGLTR